MVNGSPITALDIEQRIKFEQMTSGRTVSRQDAINTLIDDRLKIFIASRYGLDVSDDEVTKAVGQMAGRTRSTIEQMTQSFAQHGVSINVLRAKVKADIAWAQLVRGRFNSSLTVSDVDVNNALRARGVSTDDTVGYTYTLYPITIVIQRGASAATIESKRVIAENLKSRFVTCADGLRLARALRDVAVRDAITRSSADMAPQLRELLNTLEVGHLTPMELSPQGIQMFALCDKKQTNSETAAKREIREEIFSKRFEENGRKMLDEVRRSAMIEYR